MGQIFNLFKHPEFLSLCLETGSLFIYLKWLPEECYDLAYVLDHDFIILP